MLAGKTLMELEAMKDANAQLTDKFGRLQAQTSTRFDSFGGASTSTTSASSLSHGLIEWANDSPTFAE